MDTLCYKIPGFIEKAAAAGVRRAFIGLENIAAQADELETLDLYHATTGGEAALARLRRDAEIRDSVQQLRPNAA